MEYEKCYDVRNLADFTTELSPQKPLQLNEY